MQWAAHDPLCSSFRTVPAPVTAWSHSGGGRWRSQGVQRDEVWSSAAIKPITPSSFSFQLSIQLNWWLHWRQRVSTCWTNRTVCQTVPVQVKSSEVEVEQSVRLKTEPDGDKNLSVFLLLSSSSHRFPVRTFQNILPNRRKWQQPHVERPIHSQPYVTSSASVWGGVRTPRPFRAGGRA